MPKEKLREITNCIAEECLASRVRLLNRAITAIYDDALRTLGLTVNQLNLLVGISRLKKTTAKDVSQTLLMDPSTVSRNLERMYKEGWLKSTPGEDARSQELELTEKGWRLLEKAHPAWRKAQEEAQGILGAKNAAALKIVAERIWPKTASG